MFYCMFYFTCDRSFRQPKHELYTYVAAAAAAEYVQSQPPEKLPKILVSEPIVLKKIGLSPIHTADADAT